MEINDSYTLVSQIFAHEPDAIVIIAENEKPIAIIAAEEWIDNESFNHIKTKCRQYQAPEWIQRMDVPFIGASFTVNLLKKLECECGAKMEEKDANGT